MKTNIFKGLSSIAAPVCLIAFMGCGSPLTSDASQLPNDANHPPSNTETTPCDAVPRLVGSLSSDLASVVGFAVADIQVGRLTNLHHAAVEIVDGACVLSNPLLDLDALVLNPASPSGLIAGNINALIKLKVLNPELRVSLSIGHNSTLEEIGQAASTDEERETIATSCIDLMKKYGYDGLDLDLSGVSTGPSCGCLSESAKSVTALIETLRIKLEVQAKLDGILHYTLSAAMPASEPALVALDLSLLTSNLDYLQVEGFDFSKLSDEKLTCLLAPLYPAVENPSGSSSLLCVDGLLGKVVAAGVDKKKIVLGLAFEGRGWIGVPPTNDGLFQTALALAPGDLGIGKFSYQNILSLVGFSSHWSDSAQCGWAYNALLGTMISYETVDSVLEKARYVSESGLGGVGIHQLGCDGASQPLFESVASMLTP